MSELLHSPRTDDALVTVQREETNVKKVLYTVLSVILISSTSMAEGNAPIEKGLNQEAGKTISVAGAWLATRQADDGRIGPAESPAVSALALAALKTCPDADPKAIRKAEDYLVDLLKRNAASNDVNTQIVRQIMNPPKIGAISKIRIDSSESESSREFEYRQKAWQEEYAEVAKTASGDPDRAMAERVVAGALGLPQKDRQSAAKPQAEARPRRGYGSMDYNGMLNLLHDRVDSHDQRVDAMLYWCEKRWNLNGNAAGASSGAYFFRHALAKCLNASGEDSIAPWDSSKPPIQWREDLIKKLISLQKKDEKGNGYWVNEDKAYMEDDPVLVTSYAILTLHEAMGEDGSK